MISSRLNVLASSGVTRPFSTAFFLTLSISMPWPSSSTVMMTLSRSLRAERRRVPFRGFPAASLTSGRSMPWSIAFLMRWRRGSLSPSMMLLSSSVSPPSTMNSTSFPSLLAMSRTVRGNLLKMWERGIIRMSIIMAWRSDTDLPIMLRVSSSSFIWCSRAISVIRPLLMTRSSTRFIIESSRLISTLMFLTSRLLSAFSG